MMILRNRKGRMEVYKVFVDRLTIPRCDSRRRARMSIQLARLYSYVKFRIRIAGYELWILQIKKIGEETRCNIDWMANALSAESEAACKSQLLQGIQPHFPLRVENVRVATVRRSEVNQLVEIIGAARKTQEGPDTSPAPIDPIVSPSGRVEL